ncbi:class I poly(R)-hydroxyalkanoic acid synthase [Bordetella petrii]|uniref:Poly-beta-hydroxybutyrate polymerase n=1 Tax=Bordetella petrii (strain ATCC BAA-461 / DSM 12804 / CCUG 43448 / CIP 107267 / Se-1111R) TaxID=340100 RepID=A9IIX1_BORPD|nr:class I poly(R)-hydroxyalkanoic acid synthase [Bordetella petrii]CAP42188.1 poly-beta-hydroxybutyrate polymerase [Bordetella petrii]
MTAPSSSAWPVPVSVAPDVLADIQAEFSRDWLRVCDESRRGVLAPPADRRFRSQAWAASGQHMLLAHAYLLSARALSRMVDAAQVGEALRNRLRFSIMQWVDALAPSNFLAFNPDAQQAIIDTAGRALSDGLANLVNDLRKGRITQTDESQFEIGRNVATTPGQVVFQNPLFQLIQYTPQTDTVYERPLVIVPPNINKFYILDLQPANSLVRYAVEQGHTVFMVSWRNPLASDTDGTDAATWSQYLDDAVLKALEVASDISGQPQVNALGFCVGGTMLASALALAQARGQRPAASLTLLTVLLDFHDTGVLQVFVDEAHALMRDRQLGQGGLMPARDLATTFSFLRPNELVWNYVVGNYLKGQTPPAFDLLFWNGDSTNLPGPFFTWYFRNTYLENNLKVPGRAQAAGLGLDLTRLDMPAYLYGSREDHIVPWTSAYASTQLLRGPQRFVLGASGHIAGVINPPAAGKRSYWASDAAALPGDPGAWLAQAQEHPGSWWPDWAGWLAGHAGARRKAPRRAGNARYRPLEPAPGSYVKVRAT